MSGSGVPFSAREQLFDIAGLSIYPMVIQVFAEQRASSLRSCFAVSAMHPDVGDSPGLAT
jgi:hypothetical protein